MGDKGGGGKTDMERIGLFQEMSYVTIGSKYVPKAIRAFNESAGKGKQLLPGGSKENSALQHGYFDIKFNRVFDGEAFADQVSLRRRYRIQQSKKNISVRPFLPSNGEKKGCGLGSFYGTIGGPVSAFSPVGKKPDKGRILGRNLFTNPGRHGTGYGYANVTLTPYPAHSVDPYFKAQEQRQKEEELHKKLLKGGPFKLNMHPEEFFNHNPYKLDKDLPSRRVPKPMKLLELKTFKPSSPGKMLGGGKFGTFDPYPSHSADVFSDKIKRPINIVNKTGRTYVPTPGPKSRPVNSILDQNIVRSINVQNYRAMTLQA